MSQPISSAVLIGVSDYSAYDASAGRPTGTTDLFSPGNNLRLSWEMCRSLGFTPSNMALLSSPLRGLIDAHPGIYGEATREQVLSAVATLARQLAGGDIARGYIHFSGHGGSLPEIGPIMAVSDTTLEAGKLVNYVSLAEIGEILVAGAPGKPVTIVLDACGSGLVPRNFSKGRLARLQDIATVRDGDVLLSSTAPAEIGAELEINGTWYGALSWALSRASYQYARRIEHNTVMYDTSADNLLARCTQLIAGCSLEQTPQSSGKGRAMFLQPSGIPPIEPTDKLRDGGRGGLEVDGSESGITQGNETTWVNYKIQDLSNNNLGTLTTAYNATVNGRKYTDFWNTNISAWPANVKLTYLNTGGNVSSPGTAQDMFAFPISPPIFNNTVLQSGDTAWYVIPQNDNTIRGFLVQKPNNKLIWYITQDAWNSHSETLPMLPASPTLGGKIIQIETGQPLFLERMPGLHLGVVSLGYNVYQASLGL
ncbi:MAG: hypothetical protein ACI8RZ_001329 [Myxococcota bacterium]|jgi:hypothetical protein